MIQQLLLQNAHADSLIALGQPLNQPSVSISEAMNCYDEKVVLWVKGKLTLIDNGWPTFYVSCNACHKKVNSPTTRHHVPTSCTVANKVESRPRDLECKFSWKTRLQNLIALCSTTMRRSSSNMQGLTETQEIELHELHDKLATFISSQE
ncbi:unnamed protein product [Cuscuta epithymum]|uniref:Uncharacterized protein n=1 Tax=Cuscuta epithymum TaxID=186058 RepID=A0AAV0FFX9_9ASTE|nr:unnamed protein product [Cuscuta epithymum]